jgi:lipopolysaccharide transport protein LptA
MKINFKSAWQCSLLLLISNSALADFLDELPELKNSPTPQSASKTNANSSTNTKLPNAAPSAKPTSTNTSSPPPASNGLLSPDVMAHDNAAPIHTVGDELEGSLQKGRTKLKGNVVITQGDAEMKSDEAEVFSVPGSTTPQKAIAKGNVRLLKRPNAKVPEIRGVAEEIEYFVAERRVVLRGKPKIWRAQELVQGEIIELALDSGDIKIRSARSILDPKSAPQNSLKKK